LFLPIRYSSRGRFAYRLLAVLFGDPLGSRDRLNLSLRAGRSP
jgi:hypothetical protein